MRKWAPYLLIGLAALAFYVWRYRIPPAFDTEDVQVYVNDTLHSLSEFTDGPVLINFYASWCGPCMSEMPSLNQAHLAGSFKVIGLTDDPKAKIAQVKDHFKLDFPLLKLENSLKAYDVYSIPTSYLLDANGRVVASFSGTENWDSEEFMNKAQDWLSN